MALGLLGSLAAGLTNSAANAVDSYWSADRVNRQQLALMNSANRFNAQMAQQQMNFQSNSARQAMQFSAEQAALNRQWQEYMSNTAYQRAVADLKAAGLNPILAVQNGGASTPSGTSANGVAMSGASANSAMAQVQRSTLDDIGINFLQAVVNTAASFLDKIGDGSRTGGFFNPGSLSRGGSFK